MNSKLRSLLFTSLSHFSVDGNFLLFPVLITYYVEIPGLSILVIGLMPVLYNLISGFLSIFVGSYADRADNDRVILSFGIFLNAVAILIFSFPFVFKSQAYLIMILGSVILGIGQSIYHPIGATVISYTFGPKESASYLGINGSFGSLGRSVFPIIFVFIATAVGITLGLDYFVIYFLIVSVLVYYGLGFFKRKNFQSNFQRDSRVADRAENGTSASFFILILVVIVFLRSMFISVSTTYIPTYLDSVFASKTIMGVILGIAFFSAVIGQPFFGYLTSRYGGKFTISLTSIGLIVFFLLFLFLSRSFWSILISFTFFALFTYTGFPVLLGYVSQMVPKEHFTRANSLVWGVGSTIGGSAGLLLFDGLLVFKSMYQSFIIMIVFALASAILLVFLPGRKRN